MKRFTMGLLATVLVSLVFAQDADARRFGGRRATGSHMTYTPTKLLIVAMVMKTA